MMSYVSQCPALPGTYALIMKLDREVRLAVGRLGNLHLLPGWYLYLGSARGAGGVQARVGRHVRREKAQHWHIDALTGIAHVEKVWYTVSRERLECVWAREMRQLPGAVIPVAGFGSSDCTCEAHLVTLPAAQLHLAWEAIGQPAEVRFLG